MRIQSTAVATLVIKIWFFHGFIVKLLVDFWFSLSVRDGLFCLEENKRGSERVYFAKNGLNIRDVYF